LRALAIKRSLMPVVIPKSRSTREAECDLLVIGSGAAGLSAAVTAAWHGLKVIVVEKDEVCGGATAWSGGWLWIPGNPLSRAAGIVEDLELPRTYLRHELGSNYDAARVEAFLDAGPQMVEFFHNHTELQFVSGSWIADIHGNIPGAGTGGRSVAPEPFDGRHLGAALLEKTRRQKYETSLFGMGIMAGPDLYKLMHATQSMAAFLYASRRIVRHAWDLAVHGRGMQLVNGTALIARLLKSADKLGVEIRVSSPATRLLLDDGAVRGAVVETSDGVATIQAQRGVVLAAGGFPHDVARRRELFPRTPTGKEHWALPPESASGDGLRLGEAVGGEIDRSLASPVAWCPVSIVPYRNGRTGLYPHIIDRGKPGIIGVLANGRRFVNEADGYHDYVSAMINAVPIGQELASWLICDHAFQRRYPFGMSKPFPVPAWPYVRSGYLKRGRTIEQLAVACGIDPRGLSETIAEYNVHARNGEDPAFGRGTTPFNRGSGDPDHKPNPCIAPIETPPFYAVKVLPGSFGTFVGLKTDAFARVLAADGKPIEGLYAAGCDQASVMGGHYPSGGINLGPAMTFGFIAGRHAAQAQSQLDSRVVPS
jgi:succinate dehydrogenase/fumarate reductase flavoprotein subunit